MDRTATMSMDRLRLSRWAESYETKHKFIHCKQRVENNRRRREGELVSDRFSRSRTQSRQNGVVPGRSKRSILKNSVPCWRSFSHTEMILFATAMSGSYAPCWRISVRQSMQIFSNVARLYNPRWSVYFKQSAVERERIKSLRGGSGELGQYIFDHLDRLLTSGLLDESAIHKLSQSRSALLEHVEKLQSKDRIALGRALQN